MQNSVRVCVCVYGSLLFVSVSVISIPAVSNSLRRCVCVCLCMDVYGFLCVCVSVIDVSSFLNQLLTTISLMKNNCRQT